MDNPEFKTKTPVPHKDPVNGKWLRQLLFRIKVYWKGKETHIHFGCYLYQRRINCVNESLFKMLSNHICTHCDTFLCKETTCVSPINGKGDRGYEREIQAVLNNRKRKRKRSDSVLWQKPLHQQKCQKGKVTTQTTPQKSSIKQRLRTDLGRSVGVTIATQLVWLTGLRAHLPTNRNSRLIKRTHV